MHWSPLKHDSHLPLLFSATGAQAGRSGAVVVIGGVSGSHTSFALHVTGQSSRIAPFIRSGEQYPHPFSVAHVSELPSPSRHPEGSLSAQSGLPPPPPLVVVVVVATVVGVVMSLVVVMGGGAGPGGVGEGGASVGASVTVVAVGVVVVAGGGGGGGPPVGVLGSHTEHVTGHTSRTTPSNLLGSQYPHAFSVAHDSGLLSPSYQLVGLESSQTLPLLSPGSVVEVVVIVAPSQPKSTRSSADPCSSSP